MRLFVKLLLLFAIAAAFDYAYLRPSRLTHQVEEEAGRPITAAELARLPGRQLDDMEPAPLPR